jgi:hypothetical protein
MSFDPESTCRGKIPATNARRMLCHVDRCNGVVEAAPQRKSSACRKRVSVSTAQFVRPGRIQVVGVRSSLKFRWWREERDLCYGFDQQLCGAAEF